jgi:Na+-transporting methylmalonyl-CoA/oxaloacetate decarboxylase gamma subunit
MNNENGYETINNSDELKKKRTWKDCLYHIFLVFIVLTLLLVLIFSIGIVIASPFLPKSLNPNKCQPPIKEIPKAEYNNNTIPILINTVTIIDGFQTKINQRLYLEKGKIVCIENSITESACKNMASPNTTILDMNNEILTTGLIDLHSHTGVYSFPQFNAYSDGNEMTNPITPYGNFKK